MVKGERLAAQVAGAKPGLREFDGAGGGCQSGRVGARYEFLSGLSNELCGRMRVAASDGPLPDLPGI